MNTETINPHLTLMKPNREPIGELFEVYNTNLDLFISDIPLLSFNLPYVISVRHSLTKNTHTIKLKEKMQIELVHKGIHEIFIVEKITKVHSDDGDEFKVECSGLGKQLSRRLLNSYTATSKNARQLLNDGLLNTNWTIGYIDAKYDISYRSIEHSGDILSYVYQVGDIFEALVILNSVNRTVNLYDPKKFGQQIGETIEKGKLLKHISHESDSEYIVTRLRAVGKDGITISSVNSTGMPYLENYSYFYDIMSAELVQALRAYHSLLDTNATAYNGYLATLGQYQTQLSTKRGELSDLETEKLVLEETLDVKNANNENATSTIAALNNKKAQITTKQNEINILQGNISTVMQDIIDLGDLLNIENNLTSAQIEELTEYIYEEEYSNQYVSDPQILRDLAIEHFNKLLEPTLIIDIDVVNMESIIYQPRIYFDDKPYNPFEKDIFRIGDFIRVEYDISNIQVTGQIVGKSYDFENQDINLKISNVRNGKTFGETELERIQKGVGYANSFNANKWAYDNSVARTDEVTQLLEHEWDAATRQIEAGSNNSVHIGNRGIWLTDVNDPNKKVVLQHGIVGLSLDGGDSWSTAISASGIVAQRLIGQIIAGNDLTITNQSGSFTVNDNGMTVTDMQMEITTTDKKSRILIDSTNGFRIQKNTGTTASPNWKDEIVLNSNGDVVFKGSVEIGSGNSVFKANESGISLGHANFADAPFSVNEMGKVKASNLEMTGGSFNINNRFIVNSNGDFTANNATLTGANISGNITMNAGSIQWGSVPKPSYNAWEVGALSTSSPQLTYIGANGIYTGDLTANQIKAGSIDASRVTIDNLYVNKLYSPTNSTNYATLGGNFNDFKLFYGGSEYFTIYNNLFGSVSLMSSGVPFMTASGANVSFHGNVNGVNATFA